MSGDGSANVIWGGEERRFRLAIGELRELQERINERRVRLGAAPVGPMSLLKALRAADVWPDDVRDILRLGLRGAGMSEVDTIRIVGRHFDSAPLHREHALAAFTILSTAAVGDVNDPVGAKKKTETEAIQTRPSGSPESTDRLQ